jgi:hypothetical protein
MTTPHDAIEAAAEEYANERTKFTSHWMEKMNQHGEASRHFKAGWTACQSHMLTQASEGFDEWFVATYRYHYNELVIPESVRPQKDAWQAAKLSAMKEMEELRSLNEQMKKRLSECEDALRFYADKEHWFCDRYSTGMGHAVLTVVHASDEEPIGGECYYGGKRARQYFKSAGGEG